MTTLTRFCLLAIALLHATAVSAQAPVPDPGGDTPRNVILIIGDGMDEQQLTIARNYLHGAAGKLLLDSLPLRAAVQVLTIEDKVDGGPVYVSDSANTATSLATGAVTSRGRIGTSAGSDQPLRNIVELAHAAGLRSGIVTTASVTDATPAAFVAHINFRLCENPSLMQEVVYRDIHLGSCAQHSKARGGAGSIAEQLAASPLQVLLGGGSKHFDVAVEGGQRSVAEQARAQGFRLLYSERELAAAPGGERLLGLFAPSTLPVRLQGEDGREAEEPRPSLLNRLHPYLGSVTLPEPMRCEPNPAFDGIPSLRQMTEVALAQLSANNERGFFLMVESASIDKQAHERKPCGSIGELAQLEEALASALDFATQHPHTLVLVTADHAQAAQLIPHESLFSAYPIPLYTPGKLARIVTPEGAQMAVNYATTNFIMEEHTGAAVPLYSNAEGAGRVQSFLRQPDLFAIMRDYLGL
ncbi:MAG: alkaline phosphatase [Halioglobus sp.]|nr:alkaline phosphatase [Halioglobus sp.]|tara:strand:+ start:614 stop:2023 length:1410 start_codon:yes stop_codon:yes gene_type:complete